MGIFDGSNINIEHISGTCGYHKVKGRVLSLGECVPDEMCPHAFFAAYPYCLALLYNAEFTWMKDTDKNAVMAQCPAPWNQVIMKIKRIPLDSTTINADSGLQKLFQKLRRFMMVPFRFMQKNSSLRPVADKLKRMAPAVLEPDTPANRVIIQVTGRNKSRRADPVGCCFESMRKGAIFEFDRGDLGKLCPAVFNQVYPYLVTFLSGGNLNWQETDSSYYFECPDNNSRVGFRLTISKL